MDSETYLQRVGYDGPEHPSEDALDRLIGLHQRTVPFENIDIVRLRQPIALDSERLYEKIIEQRRGGFCYELNGLFAWLLAALGYNVTLGYGVWPIDDDRWTVPFDHLMLVVERPGARVPFLVDVGFGAESPVVAVPLDERMEKRIDHPALRAYRAWRIGEEPDRWRIEAQSAEGDWTMIYEVDLTPRTLADYVARCEYMQTSPDSHFTHNLICSRATEQGRVTIGGGRFILTVDGERTERPLDGLDDELALLREWFAIELDPERYRSAQ
jgi:N-hydroxyarylamine O-acetyltransferase